MIEQDQNLSMVILAGGRSRRMGTDKSDLVYQDKTFLDIQIEKGERLGIDDILISGYRGSIRTGQVVRDRLPGRGPLGGLEACFRRALHGRCLVMSVDTPLVTVHELQALIWQDRQSSSAVTILRHGEKEEPLLGIYSTQLADAMMAALEEGNGSVFAFLNKIGYETYHSTGETSQFKNINEKEDYKKLLERD